MVALLKSVLQMLTVVCMFICVGGICVGDVCFAGICVDDVCVGGICVDDVCGVLMAFVLMV